MMYFGGITWLWPFAQQISSNYISSGLFWQLATYCFIRNVCIDSLFEVPFGYYRNFVLEEKYGFNKMTLGTFVADKIKVNLLGLVFTPLIYRGAIWIIENGGENFFWYLTVFGSSLLVVFMLIWPNFISPLFNKFDPLGTSEDSTEKEKDLRAKVETIAGEIQFPIHEIYKMDGSKRSDHSQAFFFGIFKKKRIVIFDTLIDQCTNEETTAVVYHELGHWYFSHNVHMIFMSFAQFFILSYWINLFIFKDKVYQDFNFPKDTFLGFNLTLFSITPVSLG